MVSIKSIKKALKKLTLYTNIAIVFAFMKMAGFLPDTKFINGLVVIILSIGIITTLIWIFSQFAEAKIKF